MTWFCCYTSFSFFKRNLTLAAFPSLPAFLPFESFPSGILFSNTFPAFNSPLCLLKLPALALQFLFFHFCTSTALVPSCPPPPTFKVAPFPHFPFSPHPRIHTTFSLISVCCHSLDSNRVLFPQDLLCPCNYFFLKIYFLRQGSSFPLRLCFFLTLVSYGSPYYVLFLFSRRYRPAS